MESSEKIILKGSPEAEPTIQNMDLWKSPITGRLYGSREMAISDGYTHEKCPECEKNIIKKGWGYCDECKAVKAVEVYNSWPEREYTDGMVFSDAFDQYFSDLSEAQEFCEDEGIELKDLRLQHTEPAKYHKLTPDYWEELMNEDGEIDNEVEEKIAEFNTFLSGFKSRLHFPVKIRVKSGNPKNHLKFIANEK